MQAKQRAACIQFQNGSFSWCRLRLFFDRSLQFVAPGVFSYRYWIKPGSPGRPSSSRLFKCHTRRMQEWSSCWLIRPVLGFLGSLSAFPEETRLRACFYWENAGGFSIERICISFVNMLCVLCSIHASFCSTTATTLRVKTVLKKS